ncbi:unnamed protein product [Cyprideis torosa]|uniref:DNA repair protein RecN n=1 Tax=Cyprideis torosa TaxID=163714 RepID=A0A7R8WPZ8_9CRUS|nr:unnamed protein product [Cyprideis torosa]CAG0907616.1 unnamed protein product [Cyprideis torosa]
MLSRLFIRNFAIVDTIDIELQSGLTTVTGETGAGKSILINALNAVLGARTSPDVVRSDADQAEIIGEFALPEGHAALRWLAGNDYDEGGECIVRRIIGERSKASINGRPVSVGQLRELGELLVDIHGQHAHQRLMRVEAHRAILDESGDYLPLLDEVAAAWRTLNALYRQRRELQGDASGDLDETIAFLNFSIEELEAAGVEETAWDELENELKRQSHAKDLIDGIAEVSYQLADNDQGNVSDWLNHAIQRLQELAEYDARLQPCVSQLNEALVLVDESVAELRRSGESVEIDPARLDELDNAAARRLELARKHRSSPESLPELLAEQRQRLQTLTDASALRERIDDDIRDAETAFDAKAAQLTQARQAAAEQLARRVGEEIAELGLGKAKLAIQVDAQEQRSGAGVDRVEFLIAANPGEPLRPLGKVASGGELSRISLAIEVVTSENASVPTMIFDEVDVGIGGRVAEIVGIKLAHLAERAQVLCITHLAQVAARGAQQLTVQKLQDESTRVAVVELDRDQRIEEIARMIGGITLTEQTRAHAREMLEHAR